MKPIILIVAALIFASCGDFWGFNSSPVDGEEGDTTAETADTAPDMPAEAVDGEVEGCTSNLECSDGQFCNGDEICSISGRCEAGTPRYEGTACNTPDGGAGRCRGGACVPAVCGNGFIDDGEECDDGNNIDTDGCPSMLGACRIASCGDGFLHQGVEECDDGNLDDSDACTSVCLPAMCGDGFVEIGVEDCDDGNLSNEDACLTTCVGNTCGDGFVNTGVEECDNGIENRDEPDRCRTTCLLPRCGDAIVDTGEVCDDGNDIDTDECSTHCARPECGNGSIDAGEECDDANNDNNDDCLSSCLFATCGDGFTWAGHEDCDTMLPVDCTTSCGSVGQAACTGCLLGTCEPPVETCNGLDDDCDTVPDNGYPCAMSQIVPCTTSCGTTGSGACTGACRIPPPAVCLPPHESCNGVDDDCDGTCDNGFECCAGISESCAVDGRSGTRQCSSSCAWGVCTPL